MTRAEALDRARALWPSQPTISVFLANRLAEPGEIEWWIDGAPIIHSLDPNGHAMCHAECADREAQL